MPPFNTSTVIGWFYALYPNGKKFGSDWQDDSWYGAAFLFTIVVQYGSLFPFKITILNLLDSFYANR